MNLVVATEDKDWLKSWQALCASFAGGTVYTFGGREERDVFHTAGSTGAVTIDLRSQIFVDLLGWKSSPFNELSYRVVDIQEWENIIVKLNALAGIVGLYGELTEEQKNTFDEATKRRPLFE